jgi:hypothetical protein
MQTMGIVRARGRQEAQRAIRDKLAARLGGGNQPYVPGVATAPYAQAPTPASEAGWWRRLSRFNPFWMEKRTPDELRWRKHWLQLLSRVWLPSLTFILVLLGLIFLARLADGLPPALLVLGGLGLLATGVWWWWGWANWGNDLYIVTSDRIIDIEKTPLGLKTERTETMFDRVQNVSYVVPNPLATLLKYGRVIVHTAGAEGRLTFDHVPRPSMVQEEIFRRLNAYNELRRRRDQEERWSEMPEWFANYAELQRKDQQP